MNQPESGSITWRTSSYSANGGDCVEVGWQATDVLIRDTKNRPGDTLAVSESSWRSLLAATARQ